MSEKPMNGLDDAEETFLDRWSRRKQAVAAEEAVLETPPSVPAGTEAQVEVELTDADMPPLESLDENADYSGFFSPKVSEELRQLALQKLFRSACFNVCDGMDDYADDFTQFEKLGDVITADMRHRLQREAERLSEDSVAESEAPAPAGEDTPTAEPAAGQTPESSEAQLAQQPPERPAATDSAPDPVPNDTPDASRENPS